MISDNRGKSGIYRWINNINGKCYVGSSIDLVSRLYCYYSLKFLYENKDTSLICKALLKYGHSSFTLEILEYCEPAMCLKREQYYIDLLNPEYNILKIAGSSLGHIRSDETKLKITKARLGSTHSQETKDKIAEAIFGRKHSAESIDKMKNRVLSDEHLAKLRAHLDKLNSIQGTKVKITDIETNETTIWDSTHKAAQGIGVSQSTIWRYLKAQKVYKKRYIIELVD